MFGWLKSAQLVLERSGWRLWWRHTTNGWFEVKPLRTAGTQQQYGIQREIVWGMGGYWKRERVYDCCSEALWKEQHPPHPAPPFWIIHLPSLSHWPPRRALMSSHSTFPPPFVFLRLSLSISLSQALYPIGSVTLATLSKKPVCGKTEVGVLIVCLWESEMGSPSLLYLGQRDSVFLVVQMQSSWCCYCFYSVWRSCSYNTLSFSL